MIATKIESELSKGFAVRSSPATIDNSRNLTVNGSTLRGYAIVWTAPSRPIPSAAGSYIERIHKGSTRSAMFKSGIACLVEHKPELILGKTPHTLNIWEDEVGLLFELKVPDTQVGRDILTSIERGDVGGCSFRFPNDTVKQKLSKGNDGQYYRDIYSLDLVEITLTAFPAYTATVVEKGSDNRPAHIKDYQTNIAKVNAEVNALADEEYARNMAKLKEAKNELAKVVAASNAAKGKPISLEPKVDATNPKQGRQIATPQLPNHFYRK